MEKGLLKPSKVQIVTAHNGVEALEMARRESPDLIVMDLHMPKMDGITCCTELKKDPSLSRIPVIIITNASSPADREACLKAGCNALLAKPIQAKLFLDTISTFLPSIERREVRVSCRVPVTMERNKLPLIGTTEDISLHGMFVGCLAKVSVGDELVISYSLPGVQAERIVAQGTIVWLNGAASRNNPHLPQGFGVHIREITGEGLPMIRINELKTFIASHKSST
jgi:CheY-like chemotaxis protein